MGYFSDITFFESRRLPSYTSIINSKTKQYYSIEFTRRGTMFFQKDGGRKVFLEAPFVYWLEMGHHYFYGVRPGETRDHTYIIFSGERGRRLIAEGFNRINPEGYCNITDVEEFTTLYDETFDLIQQRTDYSAAQAAINLEKILLMLQTDDWDKDERQSLYLKEIQDLCGLIRKSPFEYLDYEEIARKKFHMSRRNFMRVFKQNMGTTPHEYVLKRRMEVASELLATKNMLIQEVAWECGFDTPSAFSREFKKRIGFSPVEYQKKTKALRDINPL